MWRRWVEFAKQRLSPPGGRGKRTKWMLSPGEEIAARVRRKSDGKEFTLGLAELEAKDENSPAHDLLHDYSLFFVNYR